MNRSFDWKRDWAYIVLSQLQQELRDRCVQIARIKSPSAAINEAQRAAMLARIIDQLHILAIGKATRWLAVIRRDHGNDKFEEVVQLLMLPREYIPGPFPVGRYLGLLGSGMPVFDRYQSHLHPGVTKALLAEVFASITDDPPGRLVKEHDFGRIIGKSTCIPTTDADEIVFAQRVGRQGLTRFVKNRSPRATSKLTLVLQKASEGNFYVLATAFIGFSIGNEPWHPDAKPEEKARWKSHALVWGYDPIVPGTETTDIPWYFL